MFRYPVGFGCDHSCRSVCLACVAVLLTNLSANASGDETSRSPEALVRVTFQSESKHDLTIDGRILLTAADGGILLAGRDGRLWTITPERLKSVSDTGDKFRPMSQQELAASIADELRAADIAGTFESSITEHYVLVGNTPRIYTEWCGQVLERLFVAFHEFWKSHEVTLTPSEFPLAVIVLANQQQYAAFAKSDGSPLSASGYGYYSITTNRVVLYDLTSSERGTSVPRVPRTTAEVVQRVRQVPGNVATVVHESTHQLAYNSGLHQRYADNPVWLTEGMAIFFEAGDFLGPAPGRIGRLHPFRLQRFRQYARQRPADSLITLVRDNERFSRAESAPDAYAEAWALTYFLLKTRPKDYAAYVRRVAEKPQLQWDTADERLEDFRTAFGGEAELDRELVKYLARLAPR